MVLARDPNSNSLYKRTNRSWSEQWLIVDDTNSMLMNGNTTAATAAEATAGDPLHRVAFSLLRRLATSPAPYDADFNDAAGYVPLEGYHPKPHSKKYTGRLSDFGFNETDNDFTAKLKPASDIDFEGVMAATAFNTVIFFVLMLSYYVLRGLVPSVYASKRQQARLRGETASAEDDTADSSTWPLDWVLPVYRVPWDQVRRAGGLDAYMFLRYIRMCLRITAVSAFWGIIILWPVYAKGGGPYDKLSWYHFSMANIDQGSRRIWVPTVFIYLFSFYIFFIMKQEYKHYVELRMEFLGKGGTECGLDQTQQTYSVIVERIPTDLRSDRGLYDYFDHLFPGKVHSAAVILNAPDLEVIAQKSLSTTRRLEKSIAYFHATGRRPVHVTGRPRHSIFGIDCFPPQLPIVRVCHDSFDVDAAEGTTPPPRGVVVDSIMYFTRELALMNQDLWAGQRKEAKIANTGNTSVQTNNAWIDKLSDYARRIGDVSVGDSAQTNAALAVGNGDFKGSLITRPYNQYGSIDEELTPATWSSDDDSVDVNHLDDNHEAACICSFPTLELTMGQRWAGRLGLDFFVAATRAIIKRWNVFVAASAGQTTLSSTGFVTFFTHQDMAVAACASLTHKPNALEITPAPDNRELMWNNAAVGLRQRKGKAIAANILLCFGIVFWSIPLAMIQAFAKAEELAKIPGMERILDLGEGKMKHLINDYLPVVALLTIIMILPIVFEWIAVSFERRKTVSDVQESIVVRYFYYQVANIYVTVTAGSIWAALSDIIDEPAALLEILGESIPMMVGYFMSFLITKVLAGLPMLILRGGALSRMLLLRSCFSKSKLTQRELDEIYRRETIYYGWEYPTQLLVIMIAFAYACISPVILPVAAAYFLGALIVYKKQILYVYTPSYEGGGNLFPLVCDRTLFGLIISQLTFIGYSLIRKGQRQPLFLFPLPFITLYMMNYFRDHYATPSLKLSLEIAIEIDRVADCKTPGNQIAGKKKLDETFKGEHYRQPVLTAEAGRPLPYRREEGVDELTAVALDRLQKRASRFQIMTDETKRGVAPGSTPAAQNSAKRHLDVHASVCV